MKHYPFVKTIEIPYDFTLTEEYMRGLFEQYVLSRLEPAVDAFACRKIHTPERRANPGSLRPSRVLFIHLISDIIRSGLRAKIFP